MINLLGPSLGDPLHEGGVQRHFLGPAEDDLARGS